MRRLACGARRQGSRPQRQRNSGENMRPSYSPRPGLVIRSLGGGYVLGRGALYSVGVFEHLIPPPSCPTASNVRSNPLGAGWPKCLINGVPLKSPGISFLPTPPPSHLWDHTIPSERVINKEFCEVGCGLIGFNVLIKSQTYHLSFFLDHGEEGSGRVLPIRGSTPTPGMGRRGFGVFWFTRLKMKGTRNLS